ncbi:MAG: hypothetical protein PHI98_06920 [Eubacteriales bacterium]|nr:hypothetical protein [Eubacteriales bacterium]
MKVKRFSGVALTCIGCIAAFIGVAAAILPLIQNEQLQLVLASFNTPSQNLLVTGMNGAMSFTLRHCYPVMLFGIGIALGGAFLIMLSDADKKENEQSNQKVTQKPSQPIDTAPQWRAIKPQAATANNPFANAALNDFLATRGAGGIPQSTPEKRENPFSAPNNAMRSAPSSQATFEADEPDVSRYRRPASVPSVESSIDESPAVEAVSEQPTVSRAATLKSTIPLADQSEPSTALWQTNLPVTIEQGEHSKRELDPVSSAFSAPVVPTFPSVFKEERKDRIGFHPAETPKPKVKTMIPSSTERKPISDTPTISIAAQPAPKVAPRIKSTMGKHQA